MRNSRVVSIFVLVDALGWEYIRTRPFLNDIAKYRGELTTILGYSSGAIPAILTGALPASNGHWNLFYHDSVSSPFRWARPLSLLPSALLNNRISRKIINWAAHHLTGYEGYFYLYAVPVELLPYFSYCEKRDIFRPGGINQGKSIFDTLEEYKIPFRSYTYHRYSKDYRIIQQVMRDIGQDDCAFYFLYLNEIDMFLHRHCHEPDRVDEKVALYDRWLRELYRRAQAVRDDVQMYVFSDHGMVPTKSTHDLWSAIKRLGFHVPQEYLPFYDSTMARFWFFSDQAREGIVAYLASLSCGRILSEAELKELGLDGPHSHRGDVVFLMNAGCLIVPSFLGRGTLAGMHGFHPSVPYSSGALLATVKPPMLVTTITDVHKLMESAIK